MNIKMKEIYQAHKNDSNSLEIMEKLTEVFDEILSKLKMGHPDLYKKYTLKIYTIANGYHFDESLLNEALSKMVNDDGTKGAKWDLETTTKVASQNNIELVKYNKYDWCYVMNMVYSDYKEVLGDSLSNYVKMSLKFLNDKDAPDGKALKYYLAMN